MKNDVVIEVVNEVEINKERKMGIVILLIIYLVIFICQILLFIKSVKNNENWKELIKLEICSILIVLVIILILENLPKDSFMLGFSYLGENLLSFVSVILSFFMLFITICTRTIIKQRKKYFNIFISLIAVILIFIGVIYMIGEISYNWGKKETVATIVGYKEIMDDFKWTIVSFSVNGKEYRCDRFSFDGEIGDTVKGYYYYSGDTYVITPYIVNNKKIYIPALLIGISLIVWKRKNEVEKY